MKVEAESWTKLLLSIKETDNYFDENKTLRWFAVRPECVCVFTWINTSYI